MNIAIPFSKKFKYLSDQVELNIKYKPLIKELDTFISTYGGSHRINLDFIECDFDDERDVKIIQALREKYPSYKIVACIPKYSKGLELKLQENGIPHYYNTLITTWDDFNGFLSLDVTDIFIAEELGFSIKDLSKKAKERSIALRCFCNVCQSSWAETPSLKTFFIRPEDISLYGDYIDTFEFFAGYDSVDKLNIWYEIYSKDQKWFGKINELIIGYEGEEDSRFIVPRFAEARLNCNKKCIRSNNKCHICDRIIELSDTLKDNSLMVLFEKE